MGILFSWEVRDFGGFGERGQGLVCRKRKWPVARRGWAVGRVGVALKCLLGPAGINSTARDDEGSSLGRNLGEFMNLIYGCFRVGSKLRTCWNDETP